MNFTAGVLPGCRVDAGYLQESGSEIQHTGELSIRLAAPGELGMKDDRGRPYAALTWKTLVEPEGCRAHLPPARTIADIRSGPPQVVQTIVEVRRHPVPGHQIMDVVRLGSVVGQENQDRVVELADLLQVRDELADILVH